MRISTKARLNVILLLAVFLLGVAPAVAQQTSGMITGVVQDSQGGLIPGATVTVINQSQGAVFRQLETSAAGTFVAARYRRTPTPSRSRKPGSRSTPRRTLF